MPHAMNESRPISPRASCIATAVISAIAITLGACAHSRPAIATELQRTGDEIVIAGRYFHTGAPVVLWTDAAGYDAYRVERRFVPIESADYTPDSKHTPNRYGLRRAGLDADTLERVRGGGWDLATLQRTIDQFVIHYDVCGTSRQCFRVLHDIRGLSVHFMLDLDGTIYQTLDVKERAWHATTSNDRSVGIEIANIGAYPPSKAEVLESWYSPVSPGGSPSSSTSPSPTPDLPAICRVTLPASYGDGGLRTPNFVALTARPGPIEGEVQGAPYVMHDLTEAQYESLSRLTAALCAVLPRIECDYPRDDQGYLVTHALDTDSLASYRGLIGHYHIQSNKIDPGPAFDWDRVIDRARHLNPALDRKRDPMHESKPQPHSR